MLRSVLLVVDSSSPSRETAALAHGLLPNATEVLVLQVVPQLPRTWISWPAFPDLAQDLANASAYVSELGKDLEGQGWNVSTRVHFSSLSAAEMDREILKLADILRPDLIYLALAKGSVIGSVVRETATPVLVARPHSSGDDTGSLREQTTEYLEPAHVERGWLVNPLPAPIFGHTGIF